MLRLPSNIKCWWRRCGRCDAFRFWGQNRYIFFRKQILPWNRTKTWQFFRSSCLFAELYAYSHFSPILPMFDMFYFCVCQHTRWGPVRLFPKRFLFLPDLFTAVQKMETIAFREEGQKASARESTVWLWRQLRLPKKPWHKELDRERERERNGRVCVWKKSKMASCGRRMSHVLGFLSRQMVLCQLWKRGTEEKEESNEFLTKKKPKEKKGRKIQQLKTRDLTLTPRVNTHATLWEKNTVPLFRWIGNALRSKLC